VKTHQYNEDERGKRGIFQDKFMFVQEVVQQPAFDENQDKGEYDSKVGKPS